MIIYTLKAKNRKQITLYMAEPYELAAEIKSPDRKSIIKAIFAIVILAVISWIYVFSYYGFGLSRFFVMGAICDIPSLLCIVIYLLPYNCYFRLFGRFTWSCKNNYGVKLLWCHHFYSNWMDWNDE